MDTFLNKANIYHDLQSVTNLSDWIRDCRGIVIVDSTVPILGYKEFFLDWNSLNYREQAIGKRQSMFKQKL